MAISLVRIDDRIIHGQVVTRWSRERKCDGILAIDDKSAKDKILSLVLVNAAPVGIKVSLYTVEDGIPKVKQVMESKKHYFLMFKSPVTLVRLLEANIKLNAKINVGPLSAREGSQTIGPNACVVQAEIAAFDKLDELGYEIEFQLVPDSNIYTWKSVRPKIS